MWWTTASPFGRSCRTRVNRISSVRLPSPIHVQARAGVLAPLEAHLVAIFEHDTPPDPRLRPSVLVKGGDDREEPVVGLRTRRG